ncbi:MAG TPA: 30S ribosomal protein S6 [Candidatus Hydrogenedentes bacterium]|nr:30S ribosomal protein S6 [Candidatus Hydrogenedentota bacterium]HOS02872.1 30S ribosomal protein S6 [Candidatus Hydrogenedentota bacterium]
MKTYEALYIVRPDISDDEIQTVAKGVENLIVEGQGAVVRSEIWGKRKLAYEVKHFTEGCYVLVRFQAAPPVLSKLDKHFRLAEQIIRSLVVKFDPKTLRLEEEQVRRKEAEIQHANMRGAGRADADDDDDDPPRGRRRHDDDDDDE